MVGLSLSVVALAALLVWLLASPGTYVAAPPRAQASAAPQVDTVGAGDVLRRLVGAVDSRDAAAAARLGASPSAGRLLRSVTENAAALEVEDFALRYVVERGAARPDGTWTATVQMSWRFAGYDRTSSHVDLGVGFAEIDGTVTITSLGASRGRTPVWVSGPVTVAKSPATLVLSAGSLPARHYEPFAERATVVVGRVLTRWQPRLVLEVARDERSLDRALASEPGTNTQIAGVTTAPDGRLGRSPIHVFVNPDVFDRLQPQGAQVVMSHEAVHVATRASSSVLPVWLSEGFADYVALRDVRLPFSTTAGQIVEEVRSAGLPRHLPGAAEFDTGDAHLGASYEAAWVLCLTLADRSGQSALVDLYDAVDSGDSLKAALRTGFGWTSRDLLEAWRVRLSEIAGLDSTRA